MTEILLNGAVPVSAHGQRLDQVLAAMFPDYSRSRLQQWLREGRVRLNGEVQQVTKFKVLGGEQVELRVPETLPSSNDWQPQAITLDIVYEDADVIIVNKRAGLVVHPAAGNHEGTLVNALLAHAPEMAGLPRGGLIHRLDKDTTGLLVAARNLKAHHKLTRALQEREVKRIYLAVVNGEFTAGGTVDAPLDRHPVDRKRRAVVMGGREAVTHYRIEERFRAHTLLRCQLETGRTHQIRVHMTHIHHPIVGDPVYGGRLRIPRGATPALVQCLRGFSRQALHAAQLGFVHPATQTPMEWQAPVPQDMQALIDTLREDTRDAAV
ncbi:MAG: 23S rRNA pseudouridine(1911/1915/1917) synthase RluD [Gammaproteobacteria bacterium]|nr:23S rRNA pseudouridine(1911/1915/1917) synthase RluD [Gammaproteobacteria bacterium]